MAGLAQGSFRITMGFVRFWNWDRVCSATRLPFLETELPLPSLHAAPCANAPMQLPIDVARRLVRMQTARLLATESQPVPCI